MILRPGGFSLAEVLVAAALLTSGLAGITAMLQLSAYGARVGRQLSAAVFLAEERAEQVRGTTWAVGGDCLGLSPSLGLPPRTSTCPEIAGDVISFPDEGIGDLPAPFERFTRTVRVQACTPAGVCPVPTPDLRLVTVTVGYAAASGIGGSGSDATQVITLTGLQAKRL